MSWHYAPVGEQHGGWRDQGLREKLSLIGVGYKAQATGAKLNLAVGYSHPVEPRNACWHYGGNSHSY